MSSYTNHVGNTPQPIGDALIPRITLPFTKTLQLFLSRTEPPISPFQKKKKKIADLYFMFLLIQTIFKI